MDVAQKSAPNKTARRYLIRRFEIQKYTVFAECKKICRYDFIIVFNFDCPPPLYKPLNLKYVRHMSTCFFYDVRRRHSARIVKLRSQTSFNLQLWALFFGTSVEVAVANYLLGLTAVCRWVGLFFSRFSAKAIRIARLSSSREGKIFLFCSIRSQKIPIFPVYRCNQKKIPTFSRDFRTNI